MFKRVIDHIFFGRTISNDKKPEKEIDPAGNCSVDLWGGEEVARALRGIPIPIAAGAYTI